MNKDHFSYGTGSITKFLGVLVVRTRLVCETCGWEGRSTTLARTKPLEAFNRSLDKLHARHDHEDPR